MDYPPDHLADLAVHMLSEINSHQWAASLALDSAQRGTRGVTGADGCCRIYDHKQDFGQPGSRDSALYFGRDAQGYLLVNARAKCELWPSKNGRTLPVRLTRWLVHAPPGSVVRHTCDQPDCIRISHLRVGSTSENNRDAWRRGRRSPVAAKRPHKEVVSSPFEPGKDTMTDDRSESIFQKRGRCLLKCGDGKVECRLGVFFSRLFGRPAYQQERRCGERRS